MWTSLSFGAQASDENLSMLFTVAKAE